MILEHEILIHAEKSMVWAATIDIEGWPEWTPSVTRCRRLEQGPLAVGSSALLSQPGFPDATWRVTEIAEGERFRWASRAPGMRTDASHELEAREGGTLNRLRVELSGPLAFLVGPLIRGRAMRFLEQENAGLKAWCEERSSLGDRS